MAITRKDHRWNGIEERANGREDKSLQGRMQQGTSRGDTVSRRPQRRGDEHAIAAQRTHVALINTNIHTHQARQRRAAQNHVIDGAAFADKLSLAAQFPVQCHMRTHGSLAVKTLRKTLPPVFRLHVRKIAHTSKINAQQRQPPPGHAAGHTEHGAVAA